ncbi:MAG: hypothetical protein HKM07_01920 [Chlamydiae bacterium]|nr:hypothetical protein [Chlamydiota bacterium]
MSSIATLGQIASITAGYLQTPNGLNNLAIKIPRHILQLIMASGRPLSEESRVFHDNLTLVKNILALSELVENLEKACKRTYELVAGTEETDGLASGAPEAESAKKRSFGTKLWDVFSAYVYVASAGVEVLEAAKTLKLIRMNEKTETALAYVEASTALFIGVEWLAKDWRKDHSSDTPVDKVVRLPLTSGFSAIAGIGALALLSMVYKERMKVSPWAFPGLSAAITASFIATHYRASFQAGNS